MVFAGNMWKMKLPNYGSLAESQNRKPCSCSLLYTTAIICIVFFVGMFFINCDYKEKLTAWNTSKSMARRPDSNLMETAKSGEITTSNSCGAKCEPSGSEPLPKDIVSRTTDLEMQPLWGNPHQPKKKNGLLVIPVGIKQKEIVNQIVTKFFSANFAVMLFHYDGHVDEWREFPWNNKALHLSAINQTKWWFAKRFLHPDVVELYDYIFLWDEDLDVEHFNPERYLSIIKREGLEISQPALDTKVNLVHYRITARQRRGDVHRRVFQYRGGARCYENSTAPPCTGWVEMMAPVFSKAAWRCAWYMIQNDLIHAWGLDKMLGYCAQGDRSKNVGVVDSEYIIHKGLPTLGGEGSSDSSPNKERLAVRHRSYVEQEIFKRRWEKAVAEDKCWKDPYPDTEQT